MVYQNIMDSEGVLKLIFAGGHTLSGGTAAASPVAAAASCVHLDPAAKDVISNLLLFIPNRRLGMRHDGMRDIWTHSAFARKYCSIVVLYIIFSFSSFLLFLFNQVWWWCMLLCVHVNLFL